MYGSWNYNYLCNQCLSPLMVCVLIPIMVRCTLCNIMWKVCQWLATGCWFSSDTLVSSTNKTDSHDITEILLKVALNIITQTLNSRSGLLSCQYLHQKKKPPFLIKRLHRFKKYINFSWIYSTCVFTSICCFFFNIV